MIRFISTLILFLLFTVSAFALTTQTQEEKTVSRFCTQCGWWWYEEPVKKPEKNKTEDEVKKIEPQQEKPVRKLPTLADYTPEKLWNMHPDDFQKLLIEFQKKAVQYPTPDNVKEYLIIQDTARRKAMAYTSVYTYVLQANPELNLNADFPITTPGRVSRTRIRTTAKKDKIRSSAIDYGLIYFYKPECEYCKAQTSILSFFMKKYPGWEVKVININNQPSIAAQFNVQTVPFIMLVKRNSKKYMPISVGVMALSRMEEMLYRAIRMLSGEITPEEFLLYDYQKGGAYAPVPIDF